LIVESSAASGSLGSFWSIVTALRGPASAGLVALTETPGGQTVYRIKLVY
jgi:hypothetical protein